MSSASLRLSASSGITGCGESKRKVSLRGSRSRLPAIAANEGASAFAWRWSAATTWQAAHQRRASCSPRAASAANVEAEFVNANRATKATSDGRMEIFPVNRFSDGDSSFAFLISPTATSSAPQDSYLVLTWIKPNARSFWHLSLDNSSGRSSGGQSCGTRSEERSE